MDTIDFHCPHCSRHLEAPGEAAGNRLACPACSQLIEVPTPAAVEVHSAAAEAHTPASGPACSICLSAISDSDEKTACPSCNAAYHTECWQENGGCAVYGCSRAPAVESRRAIEIPLSYWGRENKNCPKCGRQILAAAVRCRHCGATFESARPQEAAEFHQRTALAERLPAARRTIVWLFVFSILPFLAPIGAIWGVIWFSTHREELHALPTLYSALCKIGLIVAAGQTIIVVLMTLIFTIVKSS